MSDTLIAYNSKTKIGLSYLRSGAYNDIEVFIEDTTKVSTYTNLINQLLPVGKVIKNVIALGDKKTVVESARNYNRKLKAGALSKRPIIYIIDGDLDILIGTRKPPIPNLYRLPVYCLENFFVCSESVDKTVSDLSGKEFSAVSSALETMKVFEDIEKSFISLFIYYAICYKLQLDIPTVSNKAGRFITNHKIDLAKIQDRKKELASRIIADVGFEIFKLNYKDIYQRVKKQESKISFISGKDFILPVIHSHCRRFDNSCNMKAAAFCNLVLKITSNKQTLGLQNRILIEFN